MSAAPRPSAPPGEAERAAWAEEARRPLPLLEALAIARRAAEGLSSMRFDNVAESERRPDGGWRVVVDMLESKARMGSNDLICAFQIELAPDGELLGYARQRRYWRETGAPA